MLYTLSCKQPNLERLKEDKDFQEFDVNDFLRTFDKLKEEYDKGEYISPREELLLNFSIQCSKLLLGFVKSKMQ